MKVKKPLFWIILLTIFLFVACNPISRKMANQETNYASTITPISSSTAILIPTITPFPTPDLEHRPQIWFVPLPPLPKYNFRQFIGSEDFSTLFTQDAQWKEASSHIQVFGLYGEWIDNASDLEVQKLVEDLQKRGIALSLQMGPLSSTESCGYGIEGFDGTVGGISRALKIKRNGGTLSYLDLDEPYFYGSLYDGPRACHWSVEEVAKKVGFFITEMRSVFPELQVGDIEPLLWGNLSVAELEKWLTTFREVNGYDFAFIHVDVNFNILNWQDEILAAEKMSQNLGIDFGVIYIGNGNSLSDEQWISIAGERAKTYELTANGKPDHVIFESWHDRPDKILPESEPFTFSWFIREYFMNKNDLGFHTVGAGNNVAYMKKVRVSSSYTPSKNLVDYDPETIWNSLAMAPQWIEIDLGEPYDLAKIKLLVAQSPNGETTHRIMIKGSNIDDLYSEAYTFHGITTDKQTLEYTFPKTLEQVQFIRIETLKSPSAVAWYEIEIISAK